MVLPLAEPLSFFSTCQKSVLPAPMQVNLNFNSHCFYWGLNRITWFLEAVAGVGLITSLLSHLNILPAHLALDEIQKRWFDTHPEYKENPLKENTHGSNSLGLPGISGGGVSLKRIRKLRYQCPKHLSLIFCAAWLALWGLGHRSFMGLELPQPCVPSRVVPVLAAPGDRCRYPILHIRSRFAVRVRGQAKPPILP